MSCADFDLLILLAWHDVRDAAGFGLGELQNRSTSSQRSQHRELVPQTSPSSPAQEPLPSESCALPPAPAEASPIRQVNNSSKRRTQPPRNSPHQHHEIHRQRPRHQLAQSPCRRQQAARSSRRPPGLESAPLSLPPISLLGTHLVRSRRHLRCHILQSLSSSERRCSRSRRRRRRALFERRRDEKATQREGTEDGKKKRGSHVQKWPMRYSSRRSESGRRRDEVNASLPHHS